MPSGSVAACVSRRVRAKAGREAAAPARAPGPRAARDGRVRLIRRPQSLTRFATNSSVAKSPTLRVNLISSPATLPVYVMAIGVPLEVQHLDERDVVARDLAVLQLGLALLAHPLEGGLAGDLAAVDLEVEGVLLHADLGVELGRPLPRGVRRAYGQSEHQHDPERRRDLLFNLMAVPPLSQAVRS